jgi:hypothetical protein
VCAILGASLFTAQVVSWVVGSDKVGRGASAPDVGPPAGPTAETSTEPDGRILAELALLRAEVSALRHEVAGQGRPQEDPGARDPGGTLAR